MSGIETAAQVVEQVEMSHLLEEAQQDEVESMADSWNPDHIEEPPGTRQGVGAIEKMAGSMVKLAGPLTTSGGALLAASLPRRAAGVLELVETCPCNSDLIKIAFLMGVLIGSLSTALVLIGVIRLRTPASEPALRIPASETTEDAFETTEAEPEAEEGEARPDVSVELLRFTVAELKVALQTRHRPTSGIKSVLAERLSRTDPMASRAQLRYMCDLRRKHSALQIDMPALLSVKAATAWLTNAEDSVQRA